MNNLFIEHLTVIDFSYFQPQRGVVGESWIVDIELIGALNHEGMIFDFCHVKKVLKEALDEGLDHTLAVPAKLQGLSISEDIDHKRIHIEYREPHGETQFKYESPRDAVFVMDEESITVENVQLLLEKQLNQLVPANVQQVILTLRTEEIQTAYYQYSHGLKKHKGDCQRMCHGHRSRIEIFRNKKRDYESEEKWAATFADVYLITEEDLLASEITHLTHVGYDAEQGRFDVWLSPKQCYTMTTDSTVELIAAHIVEKVSEQDPESHWEVKAYEGFQKGAKAYSKEARHE